MIFLGIEEGINPAVGVNEDVRFHPVIRSGIDSQQLAQNLCQLNITFYKLVNNP